MKTHTSRIWSIVTFFVVVTFVLSFGASQPTSASQAVHETAGQLIGPHVSRSQKPSNPMVAALKGGNLVSYAEPSETLLGHSARSKLGASASQAAIEATGKDILAQWNKSHYHGPNPKAYEKLLQNEQRALTANSSPQAMGQAVDGTLRLLAIAVEFAGTDTATDFSHPISVDNRTCITETLTLNGPLHNQIPHPGPRDNFTLWQPTFERDYYEKMLFSTEGITERVRMDLTDPEDGKPGIDISNMTMRNYYQEVSGGRVEFDGGPKGITAWLQLPHSEAYYGADACTKGDAGDIADMEGLPSNPEFGFGPRQLVKDVIKIVNQQDSTFPWKDYDTDGDGYLDHVVFFHAGKDKSSGGGQQGFQAIWAHRGSVDITDPENVASDNGTPADPSDDIKFAAYTMQYEDVEPGVLVHEFGHDLGLPDLYDTSRGGESSVVWWDLMSTGSNTGKLIGTTPTNMSAWSKFALGWSDTQVLSPTATPEHLLLGQTSHPPVGTVQSARVNLPPTAIVYTDPSESSDPTSTQAWWTNNDANLTQVTLTHNFDLTGQTAPISVSFDTDFVIEEDYDYLFVEVSTDGGTTYTSLPGYEVGSTPAVTVTVGGPDYSDPNNNLDRFGGPDAFAYTSDSGGWVRVYHDLSAYAGQSIKLRFRYNTDEGTLGRGAFIDNIAVSSASGSVFSDPVENSNINGWVAAVGSTGPGEALGQGWEFSTGTKLAPKYYLLEWRNFDGFDNGLRYTYNSIFSEITPQGADEFNVDRVASNVPGMLLYLRDTRYGVDPFGADNAILDPTNEFTAAPSEGPKGGLLVVDSHPEPLRGPRDGTFSPVDPFNGAEYGPYPYAPFNNWSGRVQTTNAAFNLQGTYPVTLTAATGTVDPATTILTPTLYSAQEGVPGFHDALGYFPGVEQLPEPIKLISNSTVLRLATYAFSDPDASVVIPAKEYYPPRTPAGFTGLGGGSTPLTTNESMYPYLDSFVRLNIGDAGGTAVTGQQSGNPGSSEVQYGYHFQVVAQSPDGSIGTVKVWNALEAGEVHGDVQMPSSSDLSAPVTVKASFLNAGSPVTLTLYSDFDETQATYVEGSATGGAVPVQATLAQVRQALRAGKIESLRVAAGEATAVVYTTPAAVDSGTHVSFSYQLTRLPGYPAVHVVNRLIGATFSEELALLGGSMTYLPLILNQ